MEIQLQSIWTSEQWTYENLYALKSSSTESHEARIPSLVSQRYLARLA
jgi:hypothetical protein